MVDEMASLGVDEEVMRGQEVRTKERMRNLSDEEDPVEIRHRPIEGVSMRW